MAVRTLLVYYLRNFGISTNTTVLQRQFCPPSYMLFHNLCHHSCVLLRMLLDTLRLRHGEPFFFTSFAKSMELTYFSFGLVTAIGLQLTYTAAFMAVVSTFKDSKYFGIACGIMVSGGGIGAFATNHMIAWILSQWTLREALVIQAAFLLHAWFSAALFYWVDESAIIEEQFR
ncbi:unnamed protein product, partial [Dibothriocephalus latus]